MKTHHAGGMEPLPGKASYDQTPDSAAGGGVPGDWSFFDRIYCISLENREDRRQEAALQFSRVGLADRVEFLRVAKHPTNCEQGIYESHMRCMAQGLESGAEHILIFEDDIIFEGYSPQLLGKAIRFLKEDKDWQAVFFGCMVKKSKRTAHPAIVNIGYRSLTHAYVVRRPFAQSILGPWNNVAYDDFLKDLESSRMYAVYPSFAFQSNSPSDNDRYLPLDRFRRLCGGLRSLQRRNEFYHHYKWWIIACHIVAILAVLSRL
jgi:hypothetical protein